MFFSREDLDPIDDGYGRIYVLRFELECGTIVHKLGMCSSNRSTKRMMEILESFFKVYRYVPNVRMRRDKKVIVPRLVEKYMHEDLEELSYSFDKKFGGSTEFFIGVDEDLLLDYLDNFDYTVLLKGVMSMNTDDYAAITEYLGNLPDKSDNNTSSDDLPF